MTDISIDINADLGEFEESLANGTDFKLMRYITSANVACGGHAGNEQSMRGTACAEKGGDWTISEVAPLKKV